MSCIYLAQELFIAVKWRSMHDIPEVQMPLPGRYVSAGTLVRNYIAAYVAPLRKPNPSSRRRGEPISST
jgi:hypothetical protein